MPKLLLKLLANNLSIKCKLFIMKILRHFIAVFAVVLFFTACQSTPNHLHEPVNSTESGSSAASGDGSVSDTLNPVQPNGIDTSGEQTGRMTSTTAAQGLPKASAADSTK